MALAPCYRHDVTYTSMIYPLPLPFPLPYHSLAHYLPQESQRLMVEFADYPTVLMRMLNSAIREPHVHLAVLIMQPTGEARLDFIQVGARSATKK